VSAKQTLDELVSQIASEYLGIETLECRGRDSLDFHDVGVASLKAALKAAFAKGQQTEKQLAS
jgi:hypothetical protein